MRAYKFEPQPDEGDTNNSETLDHAMLVRTRAPAPHHGPRVTNRARPARPAFVASLTNTVLSCTAALSTAILSCTAVLSCAAVLSCTAVLSCAAVLS